MKKKETIFISYSHSDSVWRDRLKTFISALQDVHIEAWDDSYIDGGDPWLQKIDDALKKCKIAILLVSSNFLSSKFISEVEVPKILERHRLNGLRVFPIIISACPWERIEWLSFFQARPLYAKPLESMKAAKVNRALDMIVKEIQDILNLGSLPNLPPPGAIVSPTNKYDPPIFIGLKINKDNPLSLGFIFYSGEEDLNETEIGLYSKDFVSYFLTCLALPEESIWVNLSPEEPEKIISADLENTKLGNVLLEQDYLLKQFNASLMYPETKIGKKYWENAYLEIGKHFDLQTHSVNTFNKVWIVPHKAKVWDGKGLGIIIEKNLDVLLDLDYKALKTNSTNTKFGMHQLQEEDINNLAGIASKEANKILLPEIRKEVNEGRLFSPLKQVYNSLILARWFKDTMTRSLLNESYVDNRNLIGLNRMNPNFKKMIYKQYCDAFSIGVFNYIREEYNSNSKEIIPRKYFSGGFIAQNISDCLNHSERYNIEKTKKFFRDDNNIYFVKIHLKPTNDNGNPDGGGPSGGPVGGIDFSVDFQMERETEFEESTFNINSLKETLKKAENGLIPKIEKIIKINELEQLIGIM